MATLNYSIGVQVPNGPQISVTRSREIEAFDKLDVQLDPVGPNGADVVVALQPGTASKVVMLLIKPSTPAKELSFKVSDGANDSAELTLEEPQVFVGDSLKLFGLDPTSVKLKNVFPAADATKKATIEIFVGRKARA
jgi:hypothetical protein